MLETLHQLELQFLSVTVKLNYYYVHDGNGIDGISDYNMHASNITYNLNSIFQNTSISFDHDPCSIIIINDAARAHMFAGDCNTVIWDIAGNGPGLHIIINEYDQGFAQAIVSNKFVVGGFKVNQENVYAHEIGHCFGLFHTHHGTCTELSCPGVPDDGSQQKEIPLSGSYNCGDYCADTPADPNLQDGDLQDNNCNYAPVANPEIFCADRALVFNYTPLTDNIMSYTKNECRENFTLDQIRRMHYFMPNSVIANNFLYFQNKTFTSSQTFTGDVIFDGLIQVNPLVVLDFNDANVKMQKNSKIILKKRSKLIARNNTQFSGCNGQWEGIWLDRGEQPKTLDITMGPDAPILVINNSGISDANVAINTSLDPLPYWWWNFNPCTNCGAKLELVNAYLTNNIIGVNFLGYNNNNNSKIESSYFGDNLNGIAIAGTKGLEIKSSIFSNNTGNGITGGDSYVKIYDNCTFNSNGRGINLSGTFPGSTGCEIGRSGTAPNIFQGN
ncbi:MAG: hypothetical protein RLZZ546_2491, partial [Bacteroidota bacterium]